MKAFLPNNKQTPRKTRLVVDMVRGKSVTEALNILKFSPRRSSEQVSKLISSAVSSAVGKGADRDDLYVKSITANKGLVMKRFMPRAQGRATPIRRRFSHIKVELGTK
ncbi:MAG: 50S ribosomal protein L22 [bacterium]|nr:50S ribosomal protein L22 [bacterium]